MSKLYRLDNGDLINIDKIIRISGIYNHLSDSNSILNSTIEYCFDISTAEGKHRIVSDSRNITKDKRSKLVEMFGG